MKAFEEWWTKEITDNEKGYCMVAWRAALEWALEQGDTPSPTRARIQQELGDK